MNINNIREEFYDLVNNKIDKIDIFTKNYRLRAIVSKYNTHIKDNYIRIHYHNSNTGLCLKKEYEFKKNYKQTIENILNDCLIDLIREEKLNQLGL